MANVESTQKRFGVYSVTISKSYESNIAKVVIKKRGQKIFEESDIGDYYYFGNNFDERVEGKDPYSGRNITGNGTPNLVISRWNGGAHCCHFLHIFELGKNFRKIITVEAYSSWVRLIDLDHDSFPEIEFSDGPIDYVFASFAGSPGGRTILKFQNNQYELATNLMKKPIPSEKQIRLLKRKITTAFKKEESPDLPYEFLNTMMDFSYSGHFDLALKIADEAWPTKKPGLAKFKEEFAQALRSSAYWKSF